MDIDAYLFPYNYRHAPIMLKLYRAYNLSGPINLIQEYLIESMHAIVNLILPTKIENPLYLYYKKN